MHDNENIRDWNPATGDACQGDVVLFPIPDHVELSCSQPIGVKDHQLILAEGEVTGHHHAIRLPQPVMFRDDGLARGLEAQFMPEQKQQAGTAALFRDDAAIAALVSARALETANLAIGILAVEGASVVLRHDEHDPIRIPVGRYYVGRQREQHAGLERRVAD
jgi:hypothetical protein